MTLPSLTRRELLLAGGCGICTALASSPNAHAEKYFQGCLISSVGYKKFRSRAEGLYASSDGLLAQNRHFRTTGDSALDRDLDQALGVVADLFNVNPAFGFYDPSQFQGADGFENSVMNAFASTENTAINGTEGTVGFGWDLFQREFYEFDSSGVTIMAIVAHEFGHILQSKRGYLGRIRVGHPLKSEINADFLSGYFMGTRKRHNPAIQFAPTALLFERIGSYGSDRTHGTPTERLDAAEAGFRIGYVENRGLEEAVQAGLEYIA